jgi:hypothetical protein
MQYCFFYGKDREGETRLLPLESADGRVVVVLFQDMEEEERGAISARLLRSVNFREIVWMSVEASSREEAVRKIKNDLVTDKKEDLIFLMDKEIGNDWLGLST